MQTANVIAPPVLRRPETPDWLGALAAHLAAARFEDLPEAVVARAKEVLFDSIGAIAAGAQEEEMRRLSDLATAQEAGGRVPVIGAFRRAAPQTAAFLNGTAGTMLELDEGNQYARGHPGIHVVPAVLAAAEGVRASGAAVLLAIVLGYEVGARIGIASKIRTTMHPHGTWGTVGAAVAVAKLFGADERGFVEAINVASCLGLTTSRRTMLEGGTVRNTYAGFSNQIGLMVQGLVTAGFVGEADGLGTVYGTVIAEDWRPEVMVDGLGTRYEIARNYFKRHACCRYNHGALDALEGLVAAEGGRIAADAIARVEVDTYVWAAQLASREPHNMLAAKFSLPFSIATTIVHGGATVAAFRAEARADAATQALARRVEVREDPRLTALLPGLRPARVTLTFTDGRRVTSESTTNRGDTEDPYSAAEVRAKFHDLAGPVYGTEGAEAILAEVDALDRSADIDALSRRLAP